MNTIFFCIRQVCSSDMLLFYLAHSMCKWYLVVRAVYMNEIFQFLLLTSVVYTGCLSMRHLKRRSLRFWLGGWPWIIYFFAHLIGNHAKCYLVFLGIIWMEVLLLNNLHACMVCMGAMKICIFTLKYALYIHVSVTHAGFKMINKCTHYYEGVMNIFFIWKNHWRIGSDNKLSYCPIKR